MVSVTDVTIDIINNLLVPLFFVYTVTNVTIGLVFQTDVTISVLVLNRRYNWCSQFVALLPTLRTVFSVRGPLLSFNVDIAFKL